MEDVRLELTEQDMTCSFADLLRKQAEPVIEDNSPKRTIVRWTEEEKKSLIQMWGKGLRVEKIAQELDRPLHGVNGQIRKMDLKRFKHLSIEDEQFLKREFWILGVQGCAKKLNRKPSAVAYFAKSLGLKSPSRDECDPPIPRKLLPYDMVKRVAVLQRKSPTSKDKVEDAVVIFYDKLGPSASMAAIHLDELCAALDRHFGRRDGVTSGALTHGWKR